MNTIVRISLLLTLVGSICMPAIAQTRGISQLESGGYSSMAGKPIFQDLDVESADLDSFGHSLDAMYRERDILGLLIATIMLDDAENESGKTSEYLSAKGLLKVVDEMVIYRLEFSDDEDVVEAIVDVHEMVQMPLSPELQIKIAPFLADEALALPQEKGNASNSIEFKVDSTVVVFEGYEEEASEASKEQALKEELLLQMEREEAAKQEARANEKARVEERIAMEKAMAREKKEFQRAKRHRFGLFRRSSDQAEPTGSSYEEVAEEAVNEETVEEAADEYIEDEDWSNEEAADEYVEDEYWSDEEGADEAMETESEGSYEEETQAFENLFGGNAGGQGSENGTGSGSGGGAQNSTSRDNYGATLFVRNNTTELLYLYVNDEFKGPLYGGQSKKLTLSCKRCEHVYAETPTFEKSKRKICAEPMSKNEWVIVE